MTDSFHLYGINWNDETRRQCLEFVSFLKDRFVYHLSHVIESVETENDLWNQFCRDHHICDHLRFRFCYFAFKGKIESSHFWINEYLERYGHNRFIQIQFPNLPNSLTAQHTSQ